MKKAFVVDEITANGFQLHWMPSSNYDHGYLTTSNEGLLDCNLTQKNYNQKEESVISL